MRRDIYIYIYIFMTLILIHAQLNPHRCELLVVGGGSGGCSMAAKYASKLGANKVVIVEPNDVNYKYL